MSIIGVFVNHPFFYRLKQSEIGSRIANGAFWSLFGSVLSQGLILVSSIVVARILGRTEFGELGMIRSTVNMFTVFAGFGLGLTATKYVAEYNKGDKIKTGKIIGLSVFFAIITGVIISSVLFFSATLIATKTINAPHLANEIKLSALMLFFSSLNGAIVGALAGFEAFKSIAIVNLIAGICTFPLQIIFTLIWGVYGSVLSLGISFLLLFLLNFIALKKITKTENVKIDYKGFWSEWPIIYKFSIPALLAGILVGPVMWLCSTMIVNQPNGYDEMAVFDAANQWRNAILFIPAILAQITLPLLSSTNDNFDQFDKILKINVFLNILVSLILAILISLFSTYIMNFYGKGFVEHKMVLIVLAMSTVLISINNVVGQAIVGQGKMWFGFLINFIWAVILLLVSYFFVKFNFGAIGLAFSLLISYGFHTVIQGVYVFKFILKKKTSNTELKFKIS